jgi:hypothetical protein
MAKLYFDIDGTLLDIDSGKAKSALENGMFEDTVRRLGIHQFICVGSFVDVIRALEESNDSYDGSGVLFRMCRGVFLDENWFRDNVDLIVDSSNRAREINFAEDWWYVDDLAEYYFHLADLDSVFEKNAGSRILVPSPNGDGTDILIWLEKFINEGDRLGR